MFARITVLIAIVGCGDHSSPAQHDATPPVSDAAVDASPDAPPCTHGSATAPMTIAGRTFAPFQRAGAQVVFENDPFPAILIEAGPNAACACDPPPAAGPGNTLITFVTDWPLVSGTMETFDVWIHEDSSTTGQRGSGTLVLASATKHGDVTGTMTVRFPGDTKPQQIEFTATDCGAVQ